MIDLSCEITAFVLSIGGWVEGYPGEYMEVSRISQWNVSLCVQYREAGGCAAGSRGMGLCSCFGYALEILHVLRVLGYATSTSEQLESEKQRRGNLIKCNAIHCNTQIVPGG